jgi:hypothetical protein
MDQKPEIPEPEPHHSRGGHLVTFLWFFFILFIVYPLSIGPAALLHEKAPFARPAIEAAYAPITLVCNHCRPIQKAFEWYLINVWRLPIGK